jgi:copper transport protein
VTIVAFVALAWLLVTPGVAQAHAVLLDTDPADGAALDAGVGEVSLSFNEPVEVPSGGVRVFDADAERIDEGVIAGTDPATVRVALPDELDEGAYVVTWRIISLDSHVVGGVFSFTVGDDVAVDDDLLAALASDTDGAPVAAGIVRAGGYLATLLAAGAIAFGAAVTRRDTDRAAAGRLAVGAASVGVVLAVVALPVHAAALSGEPLLTAATSSAGWAEAANSSLGVGAIVRAVALAALALLAWLQLPRLIVGAVAAAALGSYLLDGHQRTIEPTWLMMAGDGLHLAAGAVWFGGLVLLVGAMRRRNIADDPLGAARLIARFSTMAMASFVGVATGGIAMSVVLLDRPSALYTTTYGLTLAAKVAIVAAVVALAAYNRQRLVPRIARLAVPAGGATDTLPDTSRTETATSAWNHLRRTVRYEAAGIVLAIGVTGFLVLLPPPAEIADGPIQQTLELTDELEVDLVVEPGEVGVNTVHAYVLDPNGRPATEATELEFELTYVPQGIGPIPIEPLFAGTGHWIASGDELAFPGEWQIDITVTEDRFTRHRTTTTVDIRD